MYKRATEIKLRFPYGNQGITAEDLYDLPLSKVNTIAKNVSKDLKEVQGGEEDFLGGKCSSAVEERLVLALDILKDVIATRQAEIKRQKEQASNRDKLQKLLKIKAARDDKSLHEVSDEDLESLIAEASGVDS